MKKVELHVHLDGSLNVKHASELLGYDARERMVGHGSSSLAEYLEKFTVPIELLQTTANLKQFSKLLVDDLQADDVIYAEVRFCPLLHTQQGLHPSEVVNAVLDGLRSNRAVRTSLILCMMRQFTYEQNAQIINLAARFNRRSVCGLDLAGDEAKFPNCQFEQLFKLVHEHHLPLTIHGGEADDFLGVEDAISAGAKRIGHGVRAIERDRTVERLAKLHIPIEVCPTSNIDTGIYPNLAQHPIRELLDRGVFVTINTDNRTVSGTTLTEEYQKLREVHGFTDHDFLRCNLYAALGSFLGYADKVGLCNTLIAESYASSAEN